MITDQIVGASANQVQAFGLEIIVGLRMGHVTWIVKGVRMGMLTHIC